MAFVCWFFDFLSEWLVVFLYSCVGLETPCLSSPIDNISLWNIGQG